MKKVLAVIMACTFALLMFTGCGTVKRAPDDWYEEALEYYRNGIRNGWQEEKTELKVSNDLKDKSKEFGYVLTDLDGDGTEELLIGIMDDSINTKFTSVIVYHSDLGPYCQLSGGDGYYIYLCTGGSNVLRVDSWYGSETKQEYMVYDPSGNCFSYVDGSQCLPKKVELTPF